MENFTQRKKPLHVSRFGSGFIPFPLDYLIHRTLNMIGDSLRKFIKISKETLQGRYTTYAKICIEMDVYGALPEAVKLEFHDEFWLQLMD